MEFNLKSKFRRFRLTRVIQMALIAGLHLLVQAQPPNMEQLAINTHIMSLKQVYPNGTREIIYQRPSPGSNIADSLPPIYYYERVNIAQHIPCREMINKYIYLEMFQEKIERATTPEEEVRNVHQKIRLPFIRDNGKLLEVSTNIDFNGNPYFVMPNSPNYPGIGRASEIVYIEEDPFGNYFGYMPCENAQPSVPPSINKVMLWIKPNDAFRARSTREHLFAEHGYYLISNQAQLPEWQRVSAGDITDDLRESAMKPDIPPNNGYRLSVTWIPAECATNIENRHWVIRESCEAGKWKIHGLWPWKKPDVYKILKTYCYAATQRNEFDLGPIPDDMVEQLSVHMPNVRASLSDRQFWSFEYCTHGRFLFNNSQDYFTTALNLFHEIMANVLTEEFFNVYASTEQIWEIQSTFNQISAMNNHRIDPKCSPASAHYAHLEDISFCYNLQLQKIDCELDRAKTCEVHNLAIQYRYFGLFHIPRYQLINYLVLTFVWPESQARRLNKTLFQNYRNEWYIYKLCPSQILGYVLKNYNTDLYGYVDGFDMILHGHPNYNEIREEVNRYWQRVTPAENSFRLRKKVWRECGISLISLKEPRLQNVFHYTSTMIDMSRRLGVYKWQLPLNTLMTSNVFQQHILPQVAQQEKAVIQMPDSLAFVCTDFNRTPRLVKVRACFNFDMQLIACPDSVKKYVRELILSENQGTQAVQYSCNEKQFLLPSHP